MGKEEKKRKGNSPSFFIGGIGCLVLAWLVIFLLYAALAGFGSPGQALSLFEGLTWQASDMSHPDFHMSFYVLGAVTQAFVAGLILMAVGNGLPRGIVTAKISLALLIILIIPFIQLFTRLGLDARESFPGILLADAILSVSFIISFVSFLSIRRRNRKKREKELSGKV